MVRFAVVLGLALLAAGCAGTPPEAPVAVAPDGTVEDPIWLDEEAPAPAADPAVLNPGTPAPPADPAPEPATGAIAAVPQTPPPAVPAPSLDLPVRPRELSPMERLMQRYRGPQDAAPLLTEARATLDLNALPPEDRDLYAGLLWAAGELDAALAEFETVLRVRPEDRTALMGSAYLISAQNPRAALDRAETVLARSPRDAEAMALAGDLHYALGETAPARRRYEAALAADPRQVGALTGLGRLALDAETYPEAETRFNAALELETRDDQLWALRGQAREALKKSREAERDYDEALRLNPDFTWHWLDRARLRWRQLYRTEGALADTREVLKRDPENFFGLVYLAEISESLGQASEAYNAYNRVLAQRPDYRFAYPAQTMLAFQMKDWAQAARLAPEAFKDHRGEYAFPWIEALSLRKLGRNQEAQRVLETQIRAFATQPQPNEMFRFLLNPRSDFNLNAMLTRETDRVVRTRLRFYQAFQYQLLGQSRSAQTIWTEISTETLRGVPEIRMAKAFMESAP